MEARYAVYYAPPEGSDLWRRGCRWLGRDPARDVALEQPSVPGWDAARLEALTAEPRLYGFHATLKPPFRLREGADEADVDRALSALAQARAAFMLAPLEVARMGGFLALTPAHPHEGLVGLADACVTDLDHLRRPPTQDELSRRREAGLNPRQEALLIRWGYPYVLDQFRFHLTLTGRIDDREGELLRHWLAAWFAPALAATPAVEDISLYVQAGPRQPFRLLRRYPLRG